MKGKDEIEDDLTEADIERRLEEVVHILHQADVRVLRQLLKKNGRGRGQDEGSAVLEGQH